MPLSMMECRQAFESLDWVFEELKEERGSNKKEAGVNEGVTVAGV